jgi:membrane-anchored mycosin MYCP
MAGNDLQNRFHRPDQIVVASYDHREVRQALDDLGVAVQERDTIDELGLVLLDLPALADDIRLIRDDVYLTRYAEAVTQARRPAGTPPAEIDDLDLLMFRLRFDFAYRYAGWMPRMGKNRYVDSSEAFGEISGGQPLAQGEISGGQPLAQGEISGGGGGPAVAENETLKLPHGTGAGTEVAVLDTDIYRHRAFSADSIDTVVARSPRASGKTLTGHGTFGAGLILKQARNARIRSVPVLDRLGRAEVWDVARQMVRLTGADYDDVRIVHMPWGAITRDGEEPLVLATAVRRLLRPGRVLVAAAGNHANSSNPLILPPNAASYPAAMPEVLAVAAEKKSGRIAAFSPQPRTAPWVDVAAPGVRLLSTYLSNGFARWSGTSFGAAIVSGRLAAAGGGDLAAVARDTVDRWRREYDRRKS